LLFSFELCLMNRHVVIVQDCCINLAIFFWIMRRPVWPLVQYRVFAVASCYFLLNYANHERRGSHYCHVEKLAIFFWIMHTTLHGGGFLKMMNGFFLLFSFELCLGFDLPDEVAPTTSSCYFLLNYAPREASGIFSRRLASQLAIFFWIMQGSRKRPAVECNTQAALAIFFWIMLKVKRLLMSKRLTYCMACYFLLNYAYAINLHKYCRDEW